MLYQKDLQGHRAQLPGATEAELRGSRSLASARPPAQDTGLILQNHEAQALLRCTVESHQCNNFMSFPYQKVLITLNQSKESLLIYLILKPDMVEHAYNPSIWKADAGELLSSRAVWATW